MDIKGLTKTTLSDFPGHVAATIYTGGCQFQCPYCYNGSLVLKPEQLVSIPTEEIFGFLQERRHALEAVCITGGEPLLQPDLCDFLYDIKTFGYKIKLDTNGYEPMHLNNILKHNLVDYVAMDIKSSQESYRKACGLNDMDLTRIKLSVDILKDSSVDYEFRTTVVRELHTFEDIEAIGQWLEGARVYYLQNYRSEDDVIMPVFSGFDTKDLLTMKKILRPYIHNVEIRGLSV